jgi:hypothetical protein
LNLDQLSAARVALWRQNGDAILTLEAAGDWLAQTGICSFVPPSNVAMGSNRRPTAHAGSTTSGPAFPAPSFLEAILGAPLTDDTPTDAVSFTREAAQSLLVRLVAAGDAVLLPPAAIDPAAVGAPGTIAASGCFAYVYALRGDRNWRQPPSIFGAQRVSPLAVDAWKKLDMGGATTAFELGRELGREVTEAAALRALGELWAQLRVLPIPQADGAPTRWEAAGQRHKQALQTAASASAPMALSALISLYLQSVIAASEDEIATFLQPMAPRNRVLEVVHGLQAARQLDSVVCEGQRLLHVVGMLPEFAEQNIGAAPAEAEVESIVAGEAIPESLPALSVLQEASANPQTERPVKKPYTKKPYEKKPYERKPYEKKSYERKPYGMRPIGGPAKPGWKPDEGFRTEGKPRFDKPDGFKKREGSEGGIKPPFRSGFKRFDAKPREGFGGKPRFDSKSRFEGKPKFEGKSGFGSKPKRFDAPAGDRSREGRPPRSSEGRPFAGRGRTGSYGGSNSKPRADKPDGFSKPGFKKSGFSKPGFSKPGFSKFAKPGGYKKREDGESNREDRKPDYAPRPKRNFTPREGRPAGGFKSDGFKPGGFKSGGKPGGFKPGGVGKPYQKKPGGSAGKSFGAKNFGAKNFGAKKFGAKSFGAKKFGAKSSGPRNFDKAPRGKKKKPEGEGNGDE